MRAGRKRTMMSDKLLKDKLEKKMRKCEQYVKLVDAILNTIDVARPLGAGQYDDVTQRRKAHDDWLTIIGDVKSLRAESVDLYEEMADERNRLTEKEASGC